VFRADRLVVKVAPCELTPLDSVVAAVRLAAWLDRTGLPVVRPAGTGADAQAVDGSTVSLWLWERGGAATIPGGPHGSLLRDLHELLDGYRGALPRSPWFEEAEARLRLAARHPRLGGEAGRLQREFDEHGAQLGAVEPALPAGPIHGDPHGGNFLGTARGWIVLDLDVVGLGHRESDWSSGAITHAGGARAQFIEGYGCGDLEQWDGYDTLLRLKLLDTVAWVALHDRATNGTGTKVVDALAAYHAGTERL
jgi:Ser/Thr protein kinase RdoA (MazF antagonist)